MTTTAEETARAANDRELASAFRVRAARDRADMLGAAQALAAPVDWTRAAAPLAEIERLAHGLAGAAPMFGHRALGEAEHGLERLVERWRRAAPPHLSRQRLAALRRRLDRALAALARAARDRPGARPPLWAAGPGRADGSISSGIRRRRRRHGP